MTEKLNETEELETMPEYDFVRLYPEEDIIVIGCLTSRTVMTEKALHACFRRLMKRLGFANRAFAHRLHWVCRIGGRPEQRHIHFLIGKTQLVDGRKNQYTPIEVCEFIRREWTLGDDKVEIFAPDFGGVTYLFRREEGECESVEISDGMVTAIKRIKRQSSVVEVAA